MQQLAMARLESGDVNPSIDTLLRLARVLVWSSTPTSRVRGSELSAQIGERFVQHVARPIA